MKMMKNFCPAIFRHCLRAILSMWFAMRPIKAHRLCLKTLPTHLNLLGHVEQITHLGTVSTDVSLIRAGSLHRANGGYLRLKLICLNIRMRVRSQTRAAKPPNQNVEPLSKCWHWPVVSALSHNRLSFDVKVILLGEPDLYYDLQILSLNLMPYSKSVADFHDRVVRSHANEQAMTAKIADMISKYQLLTFDNTALACLLIISVSKQEDQYELSLHGDRLCSYYSKPIVTQSSIKQSYAWKHSNR